MQLPGVQGRERDLQGSGISLVKCGFPAGNLLSSLSVCVSVLRLCTCRGRYLGVMALSAWLVTPAHAPAHTCFAHTRTKTRGRGGCTLDHAGWSNGTAARAECSHRAECTGVLVYFGYNYPAYYLCGGPLSPSSSASYSVMAKLDRAVARGSCAKCKEPSCKVRPRRPGAKPSRRAPVASSALSSASATMRLARVAAGTFLRTPPSRDLAGQTPACASHRTPSPCSALLSPFRCTVHCGAAGGRIPRGILPGDHRVQVQALARLRLGHTVHCGRRRRDRHVQRPACV